MSDASDLTGTVVVERYRVIAKIASGSRAEVYEAEHVGDGTAVAIKVLRPEHQDSELAARFLREGKTLGLFKHAHIVELLEVGRLEDGSCFLVTELVRGVSLRTAMGIGNIEPPRALAIVRQVADALGHAHAIGVFHRDVRPENIMLTRDASGDHVKMLDFGVAKLVSDTAAVLGESKLTQTGITAFGDPRYLAPESVVGGTIDGRADLYSTGAVLYELLTGKPPFEDADPTALVRLHAYAAAPTLAQRSPERTFTPQLEFVVAESLAKSPDARFRSAAEMITAIDAAAHSLEATDVPTEPAPKPADSVDASFLALANEYRAALAPPPPALPPPAPPPIAPRASWRARVDRLLALARTHRIAVLAGSGTLVLLLVIVIAMKHGGSKAGGSTAAAPIHDDPAALLAAGHTRLTAGRRVDALSAYERAIQLQPELAKDPQIRTDVTTALDSHDPAAAMVALELLATRVSPPALDVIAQHAATDRSLEVRHRALAIAEREGAGDKVDRVAMWSLDLGQATSCDERRALIGKLKDSGDARAIAPIRHALAYKCNERDAADALAALQAARR
ncbi:MAG: protein kinase domain-containing protein [Acidobacteriota bacterium]